MDGRATIPLLRGGYGSKSVAGAVDVSLTAAEAAKRFQKYTGVLTGNINVIAPADFLGTGHEWIVENATTGAFTLTFKGPTGAGVSIPQGYRAHVFADGTNIVLVARNRPVSSAYTPTNVSTDRAFDADTVAVAELADVVGTLIADLQAAGILG